MGINLDHLRRCRALLFPGEEDFGIVPVEAMACGAPVIAYGRGGACETVVPPGGRRRVWISRICGRDWSEAARLPPRRPERSAVAQSPVREAEPP